MSTPSIRIWPGVVLAVVMILLRLVAPALNPDWLLVGVIGTVLGAALIAVWWLFFSRLPWIERLGAVALAAVLIVIAYRIVDPSISGAMMGRMLPVFGGTLMCFGLVVAAVIARRSTASRRRLITVVTLLLVGASMATVRTGGILGGESEFHWRWTPTPEERLLATVKDDPAPIAAAVAPPAPVATAAPVAPAPVAAAPVVPAAPAPEPAASVVPVVSAWPGFRGANRDGVVAGLQIETDWAVSPLKQVWRRPIGPGWSSFAILGDLLFTQEQRGPDEVVGAYRVSTGEPVWRHRDPVRFWESNGGAGPRGTPAVSGGRVYALGATGILNALDARTGARIWSRKAAEEAKSKLPFWGFTSSPLIEEADGVVIVALSGKLLAFDLGTGALRWTGPPHLGSYSSPHRVTMGGVRQIVLLSGDGATSVSPADGAVLWEHAWNAGGSTITQPAMTPDGDILINTATAFGGQGIRRLSVAKTDGGWTVTERWTSTGLKPYHNDFVVHHGYAYGFDGSILSCIDLADGTRKWKGGRYGAGQMILLPDQNVLLVVSEEGGLALVSATPDGYKELARAPGIEGKTWNHPAVAGDLLLVRNGEEMAAFKLTKR